MTTPNRHLDDAALQALAEGLGETEAAEHAATCAECGEALATYRELFGALDGLEDPTPEPDFAAGVMARIAAESAVEARPVRSAVFGVLAAAAAGIAVFVGWLLTGGSPAALMSSVVQHVTSLAKLRVFLTDLVSAVPAGASAAVLVAQFLFLGFVLYGLFRLARGQTELTTAMEASS